MKVLLSFAVAILLVVLTAMGFGLVFVGTQAGAAWNSAAIAREEATAAKKDAAALREELDKLDRKDAQLFVVYAERLRKQDAMLKEIMEKNVEWVQKAEKRLEKK